MSGTMKKKIFLASAVCIFFAIVALLVIRPWDNGSCSDEHILEAEVDMTETEENTVRLHDIEAPRYEDVFVEMSTENDMYQAAWGHSDTFSVISADSGYPGFGKPMLFILNKPCKLRKDSIVTLSTAYGEYYYSVKEEYPAILGDMRTNVVSKITRKDLINFYQSTELLFLFDPDSEICCKCAFSGGTKIIA